MPEAPARLIITLSHQILFHSSDNYNDEKNNKTTTTTTKNCMIMVVTVSTKNKGGGMVQKKSTITYLLSGDWGILSLESRASLDQMGLSSNSYRKQIIQIITCM